MGRILEDLGIDFCCGGHRSLKEACLENGLDPQDVLDRLRNASATFFAEPRPAPAALSPGELVDHIEQTHHVYLKSALPRLSSLIDRVVTAHAARHPELNDLQNTFMELRADLEPHLMKEEQVLFPMIRKMEAGGECLDFHCGSVANPIRVMEMEHDRAGALLEQARRITKDFTLPEDGCATYRLMLEELKTLITDTHLHIHKENNLLFPEVLDQAGETE